MMTSQEPTILPSEKLSVEQGTHLVLLSLVTDSSVLYALDRMCECCADFKNQLSHILQKRVHRLRNEARFIGTRKEMDKLARSRSESMDKITCLKELRDEIRKLTKNKEIHKATVEAKATQRSETMLGTWRKERYGMATSKSSRRRVTFKNEGTKITRGI